MTEETNKITVNGKDYAIEDISDKAKYIVEQLEDLRVQAKNLRGKMDQVDVCYQGFSDLLVTEVESEPEEKSEE